MIDSDIPALHAGKMMAKGTVDISYQTGDFQSNHGVQSLSVQAGAHGVGGSVQRSSDGGVGGSVSFGPQLGVSATAQNTRTVSVRHYVVPRVNNVIDRVKSWFGK